MSSGSTDDIIETTFNQEFKSAYTLSWIEAIFMFYQSSVKRGFLLGILTGGEGGTLCQEASIDN